MLNIKFLPILLALLLTFIVFFTIKDYGITWDEPYYLSTGVGYIEWLKNPSFENINNVWGLNDKHPPLRKLLGGMTWEIFNIKLQIFDSYSAFRLPVVFFVFSLIYFLYLFTAELLNHKIAIIVTLSFFFLPRVFFDAHLGTLDYPATAFFFIVLYLYLKGLKFKKWVYISSILLGFALLTKINLLLIYISICFYWGIYFIDFFIKRYLKHKQTNLNLKNIFSRIIPIILIPPIIFFIFWPWLWINPINNTFEYISFFKSHFNVPVYYLGKTYIGSPVPWHYPFTMTLITTPLLTLIPFLIGVFAVFRRPKKIYLFVLFNALLPLAVAASPNVPKYDGVRLFLPAFPFICIVSGIGINYLLTKSKKIKLEKAFLFLYTLLFLITVYSSIVLIHPLQSSYFNGIIGGPDGAVKKGLEPEYWGNAYKESLSWINKHPDSKFWIPIAPDIFSAYKEAGFLNRKIKFDTINDKSDYLVLLTRQGFFDETTWNYFNNKFPLFSVKISKTNLVGIYKLN